MYKSVTFYYPNGDIATYEVGRRIGSETVNGIEVSTGKSAPTVTIVLETVNRLYCGLPFVAKEESGELQWMRQK